MESFVRQLEQLNEYAKIKCGQEYVDKKGFMSSSKNRVVHFSEVK